MALQEIDEPESEVEANTQLDRITTVDNHLEERGKNMLRAIDIALDRFAAGKYGSCQSCGGEIESARLKALPTATLCIDCAKEIETKNRTRAAVNNDLLYSRIDFDRPEE
jgi:DnaK suppressor protein